MVTPPPASCHCCHCYHHRLATWLKWINVDENSCPSCKEYVQLLNPRKRVNMHPCGLTVTSFGRLYKHIAARSNLTGVLSYRLTLTFILAHWVHVYIGTAVRCSAMRKNCESGYGGSSRRTVHIKSIDYYRPSSRWEQDMDFSFHVGIISHKLPSCFGMTAGPWASTVSHRTLGVSRLQNCGNCRCVQDIFQDS